MAISPKDKLHGACILKLITSISSCNSGWYVNLSDHKAGGSCSIKIYKKGLISKECSAGLLLKSSHKRRSPWMYTFMREHQEEIEHLRKTNDGVFVLFLNGDDGVACVDYNLFKQVLDNKFEDAESVRVSRELHESYRISGRDGKLANPLPKNSFPNAILDWVTQMMKR